MTTLIGTPLRDLAAVGLDELVGRAGLLTRVDRKYVLPVAEVGSLVSALPPSTQVLDIDGRREFAYRSTYFDTPDHQSFLAAGRSHRTRWKVRTRTYRDTGSSWLEVKTRTGRDRTLKQRIAHPDSLDELGVEGHRFVGGIVGTGLAPRLNPGLVTDYRRSTLFLPGSGSRATIDVELAWTSLRTGAGLERPAVAIVETKAGSTPSEVDRLLWSRGHRPVRLSKYGAGLAALHPDLPRLKWHHTLHKHLALPRTGDLS